MDFADLQDKICMQYTEDKLYSCRTAGQNRTLLVHGPQETNMWCMHHTHIDVSYIYKYDNMVARTIKQTCILCPLV